jgi:hypothetical protein
LERLAQHDSRVADLVDTMRQNAEQALGWLQHQDQPSSKAGRGQVLASLSLTGFAVGFMVAARLGHEDAVSLDELYTLLVDALPSWAELDDPQMTAGLHRGTRRADA